MIPSLLSREPFVRTSLHSAKDRIALPGDRRLIDRQRDGKTVRIAAPGGRASALLQDPEKQILQNLVYEIANPMLYVICRRVWPSVCGRLGHEHSGERGCDIRSTVWHEAKNFTPIGRNALKRHDSKK
jgi:hypothetical protein